MVAILKPEKDKGKVIEDLLDDLTMFRRTSDIAMPDAIQERLHVSLRTDYHFREEQQETTDYNLSRYVLVKSYELINCDTCDCDMDNCESDRGCDCDFENDCDG